MSKTTLATTPDGYVLVPAALADVAGKPRFNLVVAQALMNDLGIKHLIQREVFLGGFEIAARRFFDRHLRSGDLFVDVGAHVGSFALSAATAAPGVRVVAVEPLPVNLHQLIKAVHANRLHDRVAVVAAAMDGSRAMACLHLSQGTMGGSLLPPRGDVAQAATVAPLHVPTITLADAVAIAGPQAEEGRIFVKLDVEGVEPRILAAAGDLLRGGRVAALLVEKGSAAQAGDGLAAFGAMLESLAAQGFTFRHLDGDRWVPYVLGPDNTDVLCLAPGLEA